jgi:hypothetical protein
VQPKRVPEILRVTKPLQLSEWITQLSHWIASLPLPKQPHSHCFLRVTSRTTASACGSRILILPLRVMPNTVLSSLSARVLFQTRESGECSKMRDSAGHLLTKRLQMRKRLGTGGLHSDGAVNGQEQGRGSAPSEPRWSSRCNQHRSVPSFKPCSSANCLGCNPLGAIASNPTPRSCWFR